MCAESNIRQSQEPQDRQIRNLGLLADIRTDQESHRSPYDSQDGRTQVGLRHWYNGSSKMQGKAFLSLNKMSVTSFLLTGGMDRIDFCERSKTQ